MPVSNRTSQALIPSLRVALLHPSEFAQYGGDAYVMHWRHSVNRASVEVLTPLVGQKPIRSLGEARRWVRERDWAGVDVVHAELLPGSSSAFHVLMALSELPRRPALSATPHAPGAICWHLFSWRLRLFAWCGLATPAASKGGLAWWPGLTMKLAEKKLAKRLDGLVAHTPSLAEMLMRRLNVPAGKIHVIPYGAVTMPTTPLPDDSMLSVLHVSASSDADDLRGLLSVFAKLKKLRPEHVGRLSLTLAGAYAESAQGVDELVRLIGRSGLSGLVKLHPEVSPSEMPALIQRHHCVVVLPPRPRKIGVSGVLVGVVSAFVWALGVGRGGIVSNEAIPAGQLPSGAGVIPQAGGGGEGLYKVLESLLLEPDVVRAWSKAAASAAPIHDWERIGHAFYGHFRRLSERRAAARSGT